MAKGEGVGLGWERAGIEVDIGMGSPGVSGMGRDGNGMG